MFGINNGPGFGVAGVGPEKNSKAIFQPRQTERKGEEKDGAERRKEKKGKLPPESKREIKGLKYCFPFNFLSFD